MQRILLGIDFTGENHRAAYSSITQWWQFISDSSHYTPVLGVSNFCEKKKTLPGNDHVTPESAHPFLKSVIPADRLAHWTSDIDDQISKEAVKQGFQSIPFYSRFSYGGLVNRLLLMACANDCRYLVRIDPGTHPPAGISFDELMKEHEQWIEDNEYGIISRRYLDRLALRHMFVREGQKSAHKELVQHATGIPVEAQITGGAMFTQRVPGVPAVCFPPTETNLTLVWASDDGLYQTLKETKNHCKVLGTHPIPRFDSVGKQKKSTEYYRGICGAVYLQALKTDLSRQQAIHKLEHFIDVLKQEILDGAQCSRLDNNPQWNVSFCLEELAPTDFLSAIQTGYENHKSLMPEWVELSKGLRPLVSELT